MSSNPRPDSKIFITRAETGPEYEINVYGVGKVDYPNPQMFDTLTEADDTAAIMGCELFGKYGYRVQTLCMH